MNLKTAVALFLAGLSLSPAAFAQASRTWVSGVGDDANPCSRTAPCKTFTGAIPKTAAGGEINALDPGSFGGVTITKSITIDGGGFLAGILTNNGTAININDSGANSIVVTLRNLSLNGLALGASAAAANGIQVTSARQVFVENCTISGFTNAGINVLSGALTLSGSKVTANVSSGGDATGLIAEGATAIASAQGNIFSGNNIGVRARQNGTVNLAGNALYSNGTDIRCNNGGTARSAGDNRVASNGAEGCPGIGSLTPR